MKLQIRTSNLDERSAALEEAYYTAEKILRAAGLDAEYVKRICDPGETPGFIHLQDSTA